MKIVEYPQCKISASENNLTVNLAGYETLPPAHGKFHPEKMLKYEFGYKIIYTTPDEDPDKALASLVEEYNAFGILTNDTDFLIHQFPPEVHIFSTEDLNKETLDTIAFDRQKLIENLDLKIKDLPLLATLKGHWGL